MMIFRPLNGPDAPAYSALRRLIAADSCASLGLSYEEEVERPLQEFADQLDAKEPNRIWGAFDDDQLIATAGIARPTLRKSGEHKAILWGVLTAPSHRRRSLARTLSLQAIDYGYATGAERIYLYVYLPNISAVSLYESLGFQTTGIEPEVVKFNGVYHDIQMMSQRRPRDV